MTIASLSAKRREFAAPYTLPDLERLGTSLFAQLLLDKNKSSVLSCKIKFTIDGNPFKRKYYNHRGIAVAH